MQARKECIAMLLAGGAGTRLYDLTRNIAKPAVSFGGKYKIIDFPLSNCINSGIDTVGVLTQYQPLELNEYVGKGESWDLDRICGGLSILPPYQEIGRSDWYNGTANAIFQNLNFIKRYMPEYVLILSADHIYKMDYSKMLDFHKRVSAACTVATIRVPISEASRFGICNTDSEGRITAFAEKPKKPKSDKASMGIYIFNTDTLIEYLTVDNEDENSSNDFGKNVLPNILNCGERIFAYEFSGYWRDVGTLSSLWEANMDLLGKEPLFNLYESDMRVFTKNLARPPQYIGKEARIINSIVCEGAEIYGTVENSVVSEGVYIGVGAKIVDSVIMEDVSVLEGTYINRAIIDKEMNLPPNIIIGGDTENVTVIGSQSDIFSANISKEGEIL